MLEASQRYRITQSAVSQAVRRVEAATGVTLLDRSRRPLRATRAGRIPANRFHDINRDFGSLLDALRAAAMLSERADLRLGLVDSYAGTVGAHLVKELATGSMALSLTAWSGLAGSHAEALVRHTIDAAITCDPMEDLDDIERSLERSSNVVAWCGIANAPMSAPRSSGTSIDWQFVRRALSSSTHPTA